jgi:hypothetical protein
MCKIVFNINCVSFLLYKRATNIVNVVFISVVKINISMLFIHFIVDSRLIDVSRAIIRKATNLSDSIKL